MYRLDMQGLHPKIKDCMLACMRCSNIEELVKENPKGLAPFEIADNSTIQTMLAMRPDNESREKLNKFYTERVSKLVEEGQTAIVDKLISHFNISNYINPENQESTLHLLVEKYNKYALLHRTYSTPRALHYNPEWEKITRCLDSILQKCDFSDITLVDVYGRTPLTMISESSLLQLFLKHHKPNPEDKANYEIWKKHLYDLIVKRDYESAEVLLAAGVPPTYIDGDSNTVLHKALQDKNISVKTVEILLSYYPNIFHANKKGQTPCDLPLPEGSKNADAINELRRQTAMQLFANIPRDRSKGNILHATGGNALHGAMIAKNPELIHALFNQKILDVAAPDMDGLSPLRLAINLENWEYVSLLIPEKLETEEDQKIYGEVLLWAISGKQPALVDLLIERGANVNWRPANCEKFIPLLHRAVASQHAGIINLILLKASPNLLAVDPAGSTAYDFAKSLGREDEQWPEIIYKLHPLWAFVYAVKDERWDDAKTLVPANVQDQVFKNQYEEILYMAAKAGQADLVQALLRLEIETTWKPSDKAPPLLHAAIAGGHLDVVKVLLASSRLDLSLTNPQGMTAYGLALFLQRRSQNKSSSSFFASASDESLKWEEIRLALAPHFPVEDEALKQELAVKKASTSSYVGRLFKKVSKGLGEMVGPEPEPLTEDKKNKLEEEIFSF